MALQKYWAQVPAVPITQDGGANGEIKVENACNFKVGQRVVLSSTTQPNKTYKIKRIPSYNTIVLGRINSNIKDRVSVSQYLVADVATIRAEEQNRPEIPKKDMDQASFEEEPTLAWRVYPVDKCGDGYTEEKPFPVPLPPGSITAETEISYANTEGLAVLNIADKNTEVNFMFPDNLQYYKIKARDAKDVVKVGLNTGDIDNGNYWTIEFGNEDKPDVINDFPNNYRLYFKSKNKDNVDLEIRYWYKS